MSTATIPEKSLTLTLPEASRQLGFSPSLGYELAASDRFPCRVIKAGRRIVVPRREVERLLGLTDDRRDPRDAA